MIQRRNLLWIIPGLLILTFPLWRIPLAAFLAPPVPSPAEEEEQSRSQDFAMTKVTIHQNERGQKTAIIRAQKAFTAPRPHEYFLEEVDSEIFDNEGIPTTIVADAGHYNLPVKQLRLEGNVVIVDTAANSTMKTEVLLYDGRKRTIFCPEATRLEGEGITVAGSSLHHDMNTGVYIVGGRVLSTIEGYSADGTGSSDRPQ